MMVKDPSSITTLYAGCHDPDGPMCLLEAVAYVAGEPWSDHPVCVCPVLAAFGRNWNDGMRTNEERGSLLQYIPLLIGTRSTPAVELRRSYMALDWLVRRAMPAWLRLAEADLDSHAQALENLAVIDSPTTANAAGPLITAARVASGAALWVGTGVAARATGGQDTSRNADLHAVWDAARASLEPSGVILQPQAHELFRAMIAVKDGQ